MSLSTAQLLLVCFLSVSSLSTPRGGSISWELKPGGGTEMEECNLLAKPGPPPELWTLSSSTVSSCLQLLITTALHHCLSTVQMQRLFRWVA